MEFNQLLRQHQVMDVTVANAQVGIAGPLKTNMTIASWKINFFFERKYIFWVVVSNFFYFHPYLGKWSNLTIIFFRWVAQPPTSLHSCLFLFFHCHVNFFWGSPQKLTNIPLKDSGWKMESLCFGAMAPFFWSLQVWFISSSKGGHHFQVTRAFVFWGCSRRVCLSKHEFFEGRDMRMQSTQSGCNHGKERFSLGFHATKTAITGWPLLVGNEGPSTCTLVYWGFIPSFPTSRAS